MAMKVGQVHSRLQVGLTLEISPEIHHQAQDFRHVFFRHFSAKHPSIFTEVALVMRMWKILISTDS